MGRGKPFLWNWFEALVDFAPEKDETKEPMERAGHWDSNDGHEGRKEEPSTPAWPKTSQCFTATPKEAVQKNLYQQSQRGA